MSILINKFLNKVSQNSNEFFSAIFNEKLLNSNSINLI